jgi:ADP-L-glycero-D-manno-heptose 6-epimerase
LPNPHKAFFNIRESGIWNIGSGIARSFLSVAEEIGGPIEFIPMPEDLKSSYQAFTKADLDKLIDTLYNNSIV